VGPILLYAYGFSDVLKSCFVDCCHGFRSLFTCLNTASPAPPSLLMRKLVGRSSPPATEECKGILRESHLCMLVPLAHSVLALQAGSACLCRGSAMSKSMIGDAAAGFRGCGGLQDKIGGSNRGADRERLALRLRGGRYRDGSEDEDDAEFDDGNEAEDTPEGWSMSEKQDELEGFDPELAGAGADESEEGKGKRANGPILELGGGETMAVDAKTLLTERDFGKESSSSSYHQRGKARGGRKHKDNTGREGDEGVSEGFGFGSSEAGSEIDSEGSSGELSLVMIVTFMIVLFGADGVCVLGSCGGTDHDSASPFTLSPGP
jgi:hypothetical protein